jgi:hypothetical protein
MSFFSSENEADEARLASLDEKLQLVRDRTRGVAEGYANGLYLWGEGGTSKSYTVESILKDEGRPYKLTNSRITGKGLFTLLRDFPDVVHVLEDAETMFGDKTSHGVLRSALWGQVGRNNKQERVVSWQTGPLRDEFIFVGGVILIANCRLDDVPQLRAMKSRIACLQFQPTNEEVAAKMKEIARYGHTYGAHSLPSDSCLEVAFEIISRSQRLRRNLDLRLLVNTFQDRLQWENGSAETHWVDLLESRMSERTVTLSRRPETRNAKKAREVEVVRSLQALAPVDRLSAWTKETGKSQAAMYRRLSDLER